MRNIVYNDENIINDSGTSFGRGVFETILVRDKAILLKEHISRLNKSINILNIGEEIFYKDVEEFIIRNNIKNKALKIIVTEKNTIYSTREIPYNNENYLRGFRVKFSKVLRNSTSRLSYIKSLNYLENLLEHESVKKEGYDEAIFFNEKGNVAEGCTTNIFLVVNGEILTPNIENGLLPGIIREWVINNFKVKEMELNKDIIDIAEEIFLTNSLLGIMKVSECEDKIYKSKVLDEIRNKYEKFLMEG